MKEALIETLFKAGTIVILFGTILVGFIAIGLILNLAVELISGKSDKDKQEQKKEVVFVPIPEEEGCFPNLAYEFDHWFDE